MEKLESLLQTCCSVLLSGSASLLISSIRYGILTADLYSQVSFMIIQSHRSLGRLMVSMLVVMYCKPYLIYDISD